MSRKSGFMVKITAFIEADANDGESMATALRIIKEQYSIFTEARFLSAKLSTRFMLSREVPEEVKAEAVGDVRDRVIGVQKTQGRFAYSARAKETRMNRFRDTIDDLKRRARRDHPQIDEIKREKHGDTVVKKRAPKYRLPYSSDPEPVGETWADK